LPDHYIREVAQKKQVEVLEAGVARALKILEQMKETFSQFEAVCPDAQQWIESINKTKEQSNGSRTVVGVVGNTGAGKSSVINALLDEERLVPTNCMRACTAVVTEISWNTNDEPDQRYRAEIDFIDRADWEKDLKILMQEFLTENGAMTRDASDPNSDAGIAWAKFHAVYPRIHKDELQNCTVERLMNENAVLNVLGTTKLINQARAESFYTELQKFVDSREKVTGNKDKKEQKQSKSPMEYWPLIKVVRLYTKSEALSTGAVVVDLPGVHDSNAARAAVAERYIQQCSGLWIVAPITRAVDDKAAKSLLGENFKRQLKYDGNYSAVTFICSKTDDISITEAIDSLEVRELVAGLRASEQEIEATEKMIADLNESADVYRATFNEVDEEIDTWEELKDRVETEMVFAPQRKKVQKRKKYESKNRSRKRRQIEEGSDVEYIESESDDASESERESDTDVEAPQEPLTTQDIEQRLADLRSTKKNARQERKAAEDGIKKLRPTIRATKTKIADIQAQIRAICIDGRNKYSKSAIQLDFAAGIKELDQEAAFEVDEEAFNPDQDLRDYDEVANSLPVFCVSSRAYQKLCGRFKKDGTVPGFRTKEETEVPQLKNHCKQMTEGGRIQNCRLFLNNFSTTLAPLYLWASNDVTGPKLTHADKREQANYLTDSLEKLGKGLEQAVEVCLGSMKKQLREQIFERMKELVHDAIQSAPTIAESWGRHRNEGGVHWSTYKAIVRRGGVYHSASAGHRDFNAELLDPILKKLGTGWERAFQQRLPKVFEAHIQNSASILHAFHARVEERARQNGVGLAHMAMLKGSIYNYEQAFQNLNAQLMSRMQEAQRDANREFVPTLASIMMQVYDICSNECGTGSFSRMKNHMVTFVQQHCQNMFQDATRAVETALLAMCRGLEEEMSARVDSIRRAMHNDYMHVLLGVQVAPDVMNKPQRALRAEVMAQLKQVNILVML
jgi:GTPase SAR1 family protein